MITFVFGTTGELIKIYPVLKSLDERENHYELWCTGQQFEEIPQALDSLGIVTHVRWISKGFRRHSLHTNLDVLLWLMKSFGGFAALLPKMWLRSKTSLVIVHGDTMTTSVAAFFSRLGLTPVAHIEAGMRSGNIRNPFPEELSRRFVAKISKLNYAPGTIAVNNLKHNKGVTVDTGYNTVVDALTLAMSTNRKVSSEVLGLVSLHRSELYDSRKEFVSIIRLLIEHSRNNPLVFIDHPVTSKKLVDYGLDVEMSSGQIERLPKLNYFDFIALLGRVNYVVTDSGGLQQECAITGHPCLVHRLVTESFEGVGENVVISGLEIPVVNDFLRNPSLYRRGGQSPDRSPTQVIITDLGSRGYLEKSKRP